MGDTIGMEFIEFTLKLAKLANLAKFFLNQTPQNAKDIWGEHSIRNWKGKDHIRISSIWVKGMPTHDYSQDIELETCFQHERLQQAFKEKVLKVCLELIPDLNRAYTNEELEPYFEALLELPLDGLIEEFHECWIFGKKYFAPLRAICLKMGVDIQVKPNWHDDLWESRKADFSS